MNTKYKQAKVAHRRVAAMAAGAIQKGSISFGPVNVILIWVFIEVQKMRALVVPRYLYERGIGGGRG
ncbi:MAG TPA: hypothetical protein VFS97_04015 [Nitrososphaeraceae archaeon]|nr:hypothetical protein [Nitrososphaeraceae archaeon]